MHIGVFMHYHVREPKGFNMMANINSLKKFLLLLLFNFTELFTKIVKTIAFYFVTVNISVNVS